MPKEKSIAVTLYDEAFAPENYRDPRSQAYKDGVMAALRFRAGEIKSLKGIDHYELGTAEADAWYAGLDEGHRRWRSYQAERNTEELAG